MEKLITLVLTIQIAQSYTVYSEPTQIPANLLIFIENIRNVIDFEYLKFEKIKLFINPHLLSVKSFTETSRQNI